MLKSVLKIIFAGLIIFACRGMQAQELPEHISDKNIYYLLDELATQGIIELNSAVKPYSRSYIAEKLTEAAASENLLSSAQLKEVNLLLKDFTLETGKEHRAIINFVKPGQSARISLLPPVVNYQDTLFRISIKPVYGIKYISNQNGNVRHTWGGISANAYIGKNWAMWASLRDNYQTNEILALPGYMTLEEGGNYKIRVQGRSGGDYSEMRAGIAWSWKWGNLGFSKDQVSWGDNYHGANIFSGLTPSYAMIKLQLNPARWFSFTYFHGWLVSEVIDSSRSYYSNPTTYRGIFRDKYLAANMFTFTPIRKLHISAGNSVIYSDSKVQPAYLIPFMFFKSVDHTLSHGVDNQNSQMFLNISSRQLKYIHLFASVFIDEFSISRVGDPDKTNFTGFKTGFSLSGWPVKNLTLQAENTRSNPIIYKHRVETLTFETNRFNLGHYLRDNSREWFVALSWRPISGLYANLSWFRAEHGNDYIYELSGSVPVDEHPFMEEVTWRNTSLAFDLKYMLWNNLSVFAGFVQSDIEGFDVDGKTGQDYLNKYTPAIFHGKNNTVNIGFQMGF